MLENKPYLNVFPSGWLGGLSEFKITGKFNEWRPGKKYYHKGIDISVPSGTFIKAPAAGKVSVRMNKGGYGLYVVLKVAVFGGYVDIIFGHLSKTRWNIGEDGKSVNKNEIIGYTGGIPNDQPNAGSSNGAHLHLELKSGSIPLNPMPFLIQTLCIDKDNGKHLNFPSSLSPEFGRVEIGFDLYPASKKNKEIYNPSQVDTEPDDKILKPISTEATVNDAPGIWSIIKLLIDSSVSEKQVLDTGMSIQTGSLLNYFRKVCQLPFVEFTGDTYGDKYYFIVRRPPYDRSAVIKMINSAMIYLTEGEIIRSNTSWYNGPVYSWYRMIPQGELMTSSASQFYVPAVFFSEYAKIWGSQPFDTVSNYWTQQNVGNLNSKQNEQNVNENIRRMIEDFRFMVETNAYLPFTKNGTITLIGNRRIKRGMFIKHVSGEVFHVDSVSNSYSVNMNTVERVTVLNVSRGMIPEYIYGKTINGKVYSYFNIIDFGENLENINMSEWQNYVSKWKVNPEVFGFFMSKQQKLMKDV